MGCGPIMSIARRIGRDLPDDQDLTIVCGTNKQLYRRLQRRFYDAKKRPRPFVCEGHGAFDGLR